MNGTFDLIAEGLADKDYALVDDFLSPQEVDQILSLTELWKETDNFKKAGIGNNQSLQLNESIRGDYIKWLDKNEAPESIMIYLKRIDELVRFLNRNLFLSLKDFESHLAIYPVGTFYKRHLDQFKHNDHRKLSVICYLNKEWIPGEGGELRIQLADGTVDIFPQAGRLVCFRSDLIEHEVLPATRERLSITGWLLDQFVELKHL